MNKYELVFIVDAQLGQEQKEDISKQIADTVIKAEGKVINSSVWLEKHRFSFPMKKATDGTYYLINYEGKGPVNARIRQALKINERVLRFLIIKAEPPRKQPKRAPKVAVAADASKN